MQESKAQLSLFSIGIVVLSLVIGMGIFKTASVSAGSSNTPVIFFSAWIFGGLIALCGALTYAEIGARYPVTGAYYKVFSVAYHPSIAFAMNGMILVTNAASLGGVALIGSDYLVADGNDCIFINYGRMGYQFKDFGQYAGPGSERMWRAMSSA